jgi:spore maturation protein CgeB
VKIGFYIKWNKGSLKSDQNVIGDELIGEQMCEWLQRSKKISQAHLYAPNDLPSENLDIMIYLNDTEPQESWAKKHLVYIQNAYNEGSEEALKKFWKQNYDGYAFISNKLLKIHTDNGYNGIFLPFGFDPNLFYPREKNLEYDYEVAYVGSDIKGEARTRKYILPAADYNFGLYGYWYIPKVRWKIWKRFGSEFKYKKTLAKISRGRIQQENVPVLYSSAKININCTAQDCVDWDVITLRTIEVLACKGFLISDKVETAEKILKDCLVFSDGDADLKNKIDYYLLHEKERSEIASNGYEHVKKNASVDARMQELIKYLESIL